MNRLAATPLESNSESRDRWELFRAHREQVTRLLLGAAGGRLCVLGAGNCNDLALPELLAGFAEVHLVDLDAAALAQGAARQGMTARPTLHRHGDLDLTGMMDVIQDWIPARVITDADLYACIEQPVQQVLLRLPAPFDAIASVSLLSQLLDLAALGVGRNHPRYPELLVALRAGHLNLLLHLLRPGGQGFLITDFVSSDTIPNLGAPDDALLRHLTQTGNFFDGLNPLILDALFRTAPMLAPQLAEVVTFPPWRWEFGPRTYLVWAVRFRKHS